MMQNDRVQLNLNESSFPCLSCCEHPVFKGRILVFFCHLANDTS